MAETLHANIVDEVRDLVERSGSQQKILIIDDEPVDRQIFRKALEAEHPGAFLFEEAETGRDGFSRQKDFKPDCILLDFNLPDLDGLRMVPLLRDCHNNLPCAVVMMTAAGSERVAAEAMKLGVMDYLPKGPHSTLELSRTVANAIQRFRFQQEIARQGRALEQRNRQLEEIQAELVAEKERYRILAETIPQLVWTVDSEGRVLYANRQLRDFSGVANPGAWPLESLLHPDDSAAARSKWNEARRFGRGFEMELRLLRAVDQTWRWHLMKTALLPATEEGLGRWFGTFTDIDEQKRSAAALRQREKLENIGLLAGGIAHEFNNFLAGTVAGASFALGSLPPDDPACRALEIVLSSGEKAAHLTRQLLACAGKADPPREAVDIGRVVSDACHQLHSTIPANIRVAIETGADLPRLETNAGYVREVIAGLLMNAVEAIGEKKGEIRVRILMPAEVGGNELAPGNYVSVEVSDSGPGMDERTQAQIFEPFFTTKFTGRGLGLAAARGLIRSLGGAIHVTSAAGAGSTFRVFLPVAGASASNSAAS